MKHKNFFETVKEANLRLRNTIIWYHGPGEEGPYRVNAICCDSGDDFKIYMKKLGQKYNNLPNVSPPSDYGSDVTSGYQAHMDKFMKDYPKWNMVRKDLSSPHFRSFHPFPLGMMNVVTKSKEGKVVNCEALYLERQPNRTTQQGLTSTMIYMKSVTAAMSREPQPVNYHFDMFSDDFYACLTGEYPSIDMCLNKLTDPSIANEAVAFHRYFAIVRGPLDMLFLSYKGEIVGRLDNNNLSSITVDRSKRYTREVIDDLRVFRNIN